MSNNVFYDNDIDDYCRYAYSNITMRLWAANSIDEEIEWGGVYRSASHLVSYSQDNSYSGNFLKNNKQLYAQYYVGDFSIIDVDFGDFDHSEMDELILSHLNNLNSKYVEKNIPITKFKKTPELNKNKPTNNTFYTLGYPASLLGNSALTEDKTKGKPTSLYFFPDYTGPADISF
ncbi:hypothetical protein FACS189459_0120 [Bacilli bacterium]|nr:hypothetical protein FACS189459_0120 [Bacilli bacterium]